MAQLAPPPLFQFFDANGLPLAGGLLYTYAAGTTTPLATYTDSTGGTPNANPIVLDANGECTVWIGTSAYKFVLKDSLGTTQWTRDGIQYIPDGSITTIMLVDGSVTTVKIADAAVTTAKILDANVTTAKIADNAVTTAKIPDAAITFAKLSASTPILFRETSDPRFGDGPTAFPLKSWSVPTLIANPSTALAGDGNCVKWSANGKLLAVAEQNSEVFALYSRYGSTLTRMPNPLTATGVTTGDAIALSPCGQYLAVATGDISSAGVYLYQRMNNSWGALTPLSITIPHGVTGLSWHPNGMSIAATFNQTPFVKVWNLADVGFPYGAIYQAQNGQSGSFAGRVVDYDTKIFDTMNAVITGTSWGFTAYREGMHYFNVALEFDFTSGAANTLTLQVSVAFAAGGIFTYSVDMRTYGAGTGVQAPVFGSVPVYLKPGDIVAVILSSGTAGAISTTLSKNWVIIEEGGNYACLKSFTAVANPATLPSGLTKCCAWSPDGTMLAVGLGNLTYTVTCSAANATIGATYTNNGLTFTVMATISGGTTLLVNGSGPPSASGSFVKASGTGDATIAYSSFTTPSHLKLYSFDGSALTALSDPAFPPGSAVNSVSWSPDGTQLACAITATPYLALYSRSGTTFTLLSNPATLPAGQANGIAFAPDGQYIAVAHNTSPFVTIYSISGTTFTKLTDPSFLPAGNGKSVSWTPDRQYLTVGHASSPFMSTYKTSGTIGTNAVTFIEEVDLV